MYRDREQISKREWGAVERGLGFIAWAIGWELTPRSPPVKKFGLGFHGVSQPILLFRSSSLRYTKP